MKTSSALPTRSWGNVNGSHAEGEEVQSGTIEQARWFEVRCFTILRFLGAKQKFFEENKKLNKFKSDIN